MLIFPKLQGSVLGKENNEQKKLWRKEHKMFLTACNDDKAKIIVLKL